MRRGACTWALIAAFTSVVQAVPSLALSPRPGEVVAVDATTESNARQAEASIEQVQADLKRMSTFGEEVARNLREQEQTKQDVSHALSYFRRQIELGVGERDVTTGHVQRLEAEVTSLQARVRDLEGKLASCQDDKRTLGETNKKVLDQLHNVFKIGQSVESLKLP